MKNTDIEKIKDKLRKLMKKEESSRELGNLQEAEAFSAKIQQLLIDYEIEVSDLKDNQAESIDVDKEIVECSELTNRHESSWVVFLYDACARGNFCKIILNGKIGNLRIYLIGSDMNREFTHYLVHQLVPKLRDLARKSFKEYEGPDKRNTYIRSFLRGASNGIKERMLENLRNQKSNKVDAIILSKDRQVGEYIANEFGKLKNTKTRSASSTAGYANGREAGKKVEINKGVKGSSGVRAQRLLS